jgi:ribosomal protein L7/L12
VQVGFWVAGRQRQRSERAALAARLATLSRDDIPADVIGLAAADKKIHAIKRYRELTGADLREAKAVIDDL